MNTTIRSLTLFFCVAVITGLSACSGGMSDAQVQAELKKFFGEIDQAYADAGGLPETDIAKWKLDLESAQLQIVERYLAANTYPTKTQQHLTEMKDGLTASTEVYQSWVDNSLTRDTAPPAEAATVDDAVMKSTSAETQLRIIAGL